MVKVHVIVKEVLKFQLKICQRKKHYYYCPLVSYHQTVHGSNIDEEAVKHIVQEPVKDLITEIISQLATTKKPNNPAHITLQFKRRFQK